MQQCGPVVVDKCLERNAELAAITQQKFMMMGNSRRTGIEVQIIVEIEHAHLLRISFVDDIASTNGATAAAGPGGCLEYRAAIAELCHFKYRGHTGNASAEN